MREHLKLASFLAAGLFVAACAGDRPVLPPPAPALSGLQLAQQKCSGCHAVGPDGASANPGAPPLRSLYRRYPIDALRPAFTRGMEVGHRDMPRFTLSPAEVDRLLAYLGTLDPCGRPSSDAAAMAKCFAPVGP